MLGIIKIQIYQQLPFMDNIAQHIICVNCHSLKMTNKWGSPKTVSYTNLLLHTCNTVKLYDDLIFNMPK